MNLKEDSIEKIFPSEYFTIFLTKQGFVYSCGQGANGVLGLGARTNHFKPTFVKMLDKFKIENISVGTSFAACLTKCSKIFFWGILGSENKEFFPKKVPFFEDKTPIAINSGCEALYVLTKDNRLFAMGSGSNGQLGSYDTVKSIVPVYIPNVPFLIVKKKSYIYFFFDFFFLCLIRHPTNTKKKSTY